MQLKRRIAIAVLLLAAYPVTAATLLLLEEHGRLTLSWEHVMAARFFSGIASFWGVAMFVAENQSRKEIRRFQRKAPPKHAPGNIRR